MYEASVIPYRIALMTSDEDQNFQSVRLRPHAFLVCCSLGEVRFSLGECAPCQARSVQSGEKFCACSKLGTDSIGQRRPLDVW